MNKSRIDILLSDSHYYHRIMGTLVISLILAISIFKFWPKTIKEVKEFYNFDNEAIIVEEMIVTKQANTPASPPKPQVPIPIPNEEILEIIIDFPELDDMINTDPLSETLTTGQRGDEERISGNPDKPPRVVKIVEPVIPDDAKRSNIKASITVNFTVLSNGSVKEAYISEIKRYKENGRDFEFVDNIGFGLLEATLEAAYKWKFRPATEDGEKVGAYIQDVFTFGF